MTNPQLGFEELIANQSQSHLTVNAGDRSITQALAGELSIDFESDADLTLDGEQWQYATLIFTDSGTVLTAPRDVIYPDVDAQTEGVSRMRFLVRNDTAEELTIKRSGQTGVSISAAGAVLVQHDGNDIVAVTAGADSAAEDVSYDNSLSGLDATNVQNAIDEVLSLATNTSSGGGSSVDVQVFTSNGTWINPGSGLTYAFVAGGGGGGGSGRKRAAASTGGGGGGGGGGAWSAHTFNAADLAGSVSVVVGAGGTGGAAQATDSTNGNNGTTGGTSSFGSYLSAAGGTHGGGGTTSGGFSSSGGSATGFVPGTNGAAGGTGGGSPGSDAPIGTLPNFRCTGGGGGGGVSSGNTPAGGAPSGGIPAIGATGTAGGTVGAGQNGTAGTSHGSAPSLGGGGGAGNATAGQSGGTGGAGGTPGGGGGGGGAGTDGAGASGAGGVGGAGRVVVITTF